MSFCCWKYSVATLSAVQEVQHYTSDNRRLLHSVYLLYAEPSEDGALITLDHFRYLKSLALTRGLPPTYHHLVRYSSAWGQMSAELILEKHQVRMLGQMSAELIWEKHQVRMYRTMAESSLVRQRTGDFSRCKYILKYPRLFVSHTNFHIKDYRISAVLLCLCTCLVGTRMSPELWFE